MTQSTGLLLLSRESIRGGRFDGKGVKEFWVAESDIRETTFEGFNVRQGSLGGGERMSTFQQCVFRSSTLRIMTPGRVRFEHCQFDDVTLAGWICLNAEFVDCRFRGRLDKMVFDAALRPMDADELGRSRNQYDDNDFSRCQFIDVAFRGGIELRRPLLPKGGIFLPCAGEALAHLRGVQMNLSEAQQAIVNAWVSVRSETVARGQRQLYESDADLTAVDADEEAAFEAIRTALAPYDESV
jgi:uncharacterized protein YjbI with pentapeptide repeats